MKHSDWFQNCTPTQALNGKTPYEMQQGRKPNLAGIQEFETVAYVKDLHAGKLDPRVQVGRFVGYDSERKGYHIYWPKNKTISVERNVVFNKNDITLGDKTIPIPGDALAEGEKDKVIQSPKLTPSSDKLDNQTEPENEPDVEEELEKVLFPSESPLTEDSAQEAPPTPIQCCTERLRDQPAQCQGFFKDQMARKAHLEVHTVCQFEEKEEVEDITSLHDDSADLDDVDPPPDFDAFTNFEALGTSMGNEPKTLDEAFNGPKANEWSHLQI